MKIQTEAAEEWLSTKVEGLQTTFAKAVTTLLTLAGPLFLLWSGLSTANKIVGICLWVSVTLNSFLLAKVCWYRTENRRRLADLAKIPDPPELDGFDLSVLIRLVAYDMGCGVQRLAGDMGVQPYKVSHSTDKLLAWGFVDNTRESTASGAEFRANAKGRNHCINPPKK
jgi:hypothetical protein